MYFLALWSGCEVEGERKLEIVVHHQDPALQNFGKLINAQFQETILFCVYLWVHINNEGFFLLINFCKVILIWNIICWRKGGKEAKKNTHFWYSWHCRLLILYSPWLNWVRWYLKTRNERNKLYLCRKINLTFLHLISILYINTSITTCGGLTLAKGQTPTSCSLTPSDQQSRGRK